jgi:hydrogenase expression/formation protein HypC
VCLALPMVLESVEGDRGTAVLNGVRIPVGLALLEEPRVGDFVLVHAGFAIERLDPEAAEETLSLLRAGEPVEEGP